MTKTPPDESATARTPSRPEPRVAKGFRDIEAAELRQQRAMLEKIRVVYERYGFEPLETPVMEYTDALGKFLPDTDRPNAGVFSLQDEDEQWMSLRYDLTAPLARYFAENAQRLPKPFRRYAMGSVFRNEKPGPGRFRQFTQFDADTVGSDNIAADAEMCMLAADALEALGIRRGDYIIKVNNRKVLDGVMEAAGLTGDQNFQRRLTVLRAIDKLDRLKLDGVRQLLGRGRTDESGDFTKGADLESDKVDVIVRYLTTRYGSSTPEEREAADKAGERPDLFRGSFDPIFSSHEMYFRDWRSTVATSSTGLQGVDELEAIANLVRTAGYGPGRIAFDPSCVRGLEYYTGPVFEAELTFPVTGDDGQPVRFGSVGGGGRYDDLVARFTGEKVPATGFSIGVSRLQAALNVIGQNSTTEPGPVVVLVMDKDQLGHYQMLTQKLRSADPPIRAEMYLGSSGMKAQMKYADKRGAPCVIIQGSDERAKGEVTIKDLIEGAKAADAIKDNKDWKAARPAQIAVAEDKMIDAVREILARHQ